MKASITSHIPKQFEPIKLEITIETEEELYELYHRMNNNALPPAYKGDVECGRISSKGLSYSSHSSEYIAFESTASNPIFKLLSPFISKKGAF